MAVQLLRNAKVYLDQFDLSTRVNKVAIGLSSQPQKATALGNDTDVFAPGINRLKVAHEGYWEGGTGNIDETLFNRIGTGLVTGSVHSICPTTGAEGEPGYTAPVISTNYKPGAQVGQMFAFGYDAELAASQLVRSTIIASKTAVVASGNGTAFQVGAIAAGQSLYLGIHVLAIAGTGTPTLTAQVQSSTVIGFGSPTNRGATSVWTAVGGSFLTLLSTAVTDTWWRLNYTITGSSPSFNFVAFLGIQ